MIQNPEGFVACKGRDVTGQEVLKAPLRVKVKITRPDESTISVRPEECPHYTGDGRAACSAAGPDGDRKPGTSVRASCPYSVNLPRSLDSLFHRIRHPELPL